MFEKVLQHEYLYGCIRHHCHENGVGVTLAEELSEDDGSARPDKVLILKVDHYYSSQNFAQPPPSIDFLIIVRCEDGGYDFYLVELRNTALTASVRAKEIVAKFRTVIDDFLGSRYTEIFASDDVRINRIRAYLVTNPLGATNADEFRRYMKGTTLDAYGQLPPLVFNGQPFIIEPILPNPAVENC